jgi:hypothetical protein
MVFRRSNGRFIAGAALVGFMLAVAGCQSSDGGGLLGVGGDSKQAAKPEAGAVAGPAAGKVTAGSLRAYCPKVTLRDGTAYFNTYGSGGRKVASADDSVDASTQNDSSNIIYQAAITDVTRDCTHAGGTMTLNIGVAGKVVPGPLGKPGAITMPIRIVVMRGTDVLYTKLHQYKVQVSDMSAATQFVFSDPAIAVPEPTIANYQVFAGYDEGATAPRKPAKKRVVRRRAPATAAAPAPAKTPAGSQTSVSDIPR